jgi:hypothetical protein
VSDACCSAGECPRPVYKDGICVGHYKRRQRGQDMGPLRDARGGALGPKDPQDRLKDASITYADALEVEADNDRAWANLIDAAEWVALGVPKTPRLQKLGYRLLAEMRAQMRAALRGDEAPSHSVSQHGAAHRVHR